LSQPPGNLNSVRQASNWIDSTQPARRASGVSFAHDSDIFITIEPFRNDRLTRKENGFKYAKGATSDCSNNRAIDEEPDECRTPFELDRDRILHSSCFRRLSGKTQVFVFPKDHQRTRLTHALEVAQVATSISRAVGLNVSLTEAISLGHDCGHGPGGHVSEDVFSKYLPSGFNHATWGAEVTLAGLNLCKETLDGIAHHSWSLSGPSTPEAVVVSWADRIAYCCHDLEDAISAGILKDKDIPKEIKKTLGKSRSRQLNSLINGIINAILSTGKIGMLNETAEALSLFRQFNYEKIYMSDVSQKAGKKMARVLDDLVSYFIEHPGKIKDKRSGDNHLDAVNYVAKMTDKYAIVCAAKYLSYKRTPFLLP
jgi:dGTPase